MDIGERIKSARNMAGLSQRALAEAVGVSAMAISKYERGTAVPGSGVLIRLAKALKTKTEYFLRPVTIKLTEPPYRKRASLARKEETAFQARICEWLERYVAVDELFGGLLRFEIPEGFNARVNSFDDAEKSAERLRQKWRLGMDPVENLSEELEAKGIKVGLVEAHKDFDALAFWLNGQVPVIVTKAGLPGDRQRFNLAHELGHIVLKPLQNVDREKAAFRFAGAFLVPRLAALLELGKRRRMLDLYELHLLKHKYGLSMQGWIYRAKDLNILSEPAATRMFAWFRSEGWHKKEPGDPIPSEEPGRMKRLIMRALAEDLISDSRAAELLGRPIAVFRKEESDRHAKFPVGVRR